jgi:hypothetical protein
MYALALIVLEKMFFSESNYSLVLLNYKSSKLLVSVDMFIRGCIVKFRYSEKATKIRPIFHSFFDIT